MSFIAILDKKKGNSQEEGKALVKASTSWCWEWDALAWWNHRQLYHEQNDDRSLYVWSSHEKKKWLEARWIGAWLSQNKKCKRGNRNLKIL